MWVNPTMAFKYMQIKQREKHRHCCIYEYNHDSFVAFKDTKELSENMKFNMNMKSNGYCFILKNIIFIT